MKKISYQTKDHNYSNPAAYDLRKIDPLERYLDSLWQPIINAVGAQYIDHDDVVCDFGCGTLAHVSAQQTAHKIYAIDINLAMVSHGLKHLPPELQAQIIPVITSATDTALPGGSCSVVWSIGLTEYVELSSLFSEMTRVSNPQAVMLIQFPNKYHPVHMAIRLVNLLRNQRTKKFRSLREIRAQAKVHHWQLVSTFRTGFYFPVPKIILPYCIPVWRRFNWLGNNVLVVLQRANP